MITILYNNRVFSMKIEKYSNLRYFQMKHIIFTSVNVIHRNFVQLLL